MSEPQKPDLGTNLMRPCRRCAKARQALAQLNGQLHGFCLIGAEPDEEHDPCLSRPDVVTYGPWRLQCHDCSGTGLEPTVRGRRLLAFVRQFLDGVQSSDLSITVQQIQQDEEIPF